MNCPIFAISSFMCAAFHSFDLSSIVAAAPFM